MSEQECKCIDGDCINGKGTYLYSDGTKYKGNWKNGKEHGYGVLNYHNDAKFSGYFVEGKRNGEGTAIDAAGNRYNGQWKNDKEDGFGMLHCTDGTKYEGEWKEGKEHGKGKIVYPDGTILHGQWVDGELTKKHEK